MYITLNKHKYKYNPNLLQSIYTIKEDINNNILKKKGIKIETKKIMLFHKKNVLDDSKCLFFYNIKKDDTIKIVLKNVGGVDGALINRFVGGIFGVLFLLIFMMTGLMPLFIFILCKMATTIVEIGLNFIQTYLLSRNNFLWSFIEYIKTGLLPIALVILKYFGIVIGVFLMVFCASYPIYEYTFVIKEGEERGQCTAYRRARTFAILMTLVFLAQYFIGANISVFGRLLTFIPPLAKIGDNLIRGTTQSKLNFGTNTPLVGIVFYLGVMITKFGIKAFNYAKMYGMKILYDWDTIYKLSLDPAVDIELRTYLLRDVVDQIQAASLYQAGKTFYRLPMSYMELSSMILLRTMFQTLIFLIYQFIDIVDVCPKKSDRLGRILNDIDLAESKLKKFQQAVANPQTTKPEKKEYLGTISKIEKELVKVKLKLEKEQLLAPIDGDCLVDIVVNGGWLNLIIFLSYVLFLILLCFFNIPI